MGQLMLGDNEFMVGREVETGRLVHLITYNFIQEVYRVIDVDGTGDFKDVHKDEIEILEELLTYETGDVSRSLFEGSIIQSDFFLREIEGVDAYGDVLFRVYLLKENGELEFLYRTKTSIDLLQAHVHEEVSHVAVYDGILVWYEIMAQLTGEIKEMESPFERTNIRYGYYQDKLCTFGYDKDHDTVDILPALAIGTNYERLTLAMNLFLQAIEDGEVEFCTENDFFIGFHQMVEEAKTHKIQFQEWDELNKELKEMMKQIEEEETNEDDIAKEQAYVSEEESLWEMLFRDTPTHELETQRVNMERQIEIEEIIEELTGEPIQLDVLSASSKEEVGLDHLSEWEFRSYQVEMMSTLAKACRYLSEQGMYPLDKVEEMEHMIEWLQLIFTKLEETTKGAIQ